MSAVFSMARGLWLALLTAAPTHPERELCDLAVRSEALEYASFESAAALRLPELRLREVDGTADEACAGQLHAYLELRLEGDDRWQLSLIISDGRAWYRTVEASPAEAPRALASALANLLAAIDDPALAPDARGVELPAELGEPAPAPESKPQPEPEPDAPPEPEPEPEPEIEIEIDRRPVLMELGPRMSGVVVLGLAPGPGLRGGGGALGLDLRLPDGLGFGFDLRAATRARQGVSLTRTRVALGLGIMPRTGIFEIPVIFSAVIEPWFARESRSVVPLGQPPLIGGGVRVAPGLLIPVGELKLRLGVALGFEIAVEAAPGALTAAIALEPGGEPIHRAGGVELSGGVELGLWIPVRGRAGG